MKQQNNNRYEELNYLHKEWEVTLVIGKDEAIGELEVILKKDNFNAHSQFKAT